MALYLVVHHRQDSNQPWANAWEDDQKLLAIQTTSQIGKLCTEAKNAGNPVFIHRCGWGDDDPTICCETEVDSIEKLPGGGSYVRFCQQRILGGTPEYQASRGENFYKLTD